MLEDDVWYGDDFGKNQTIHVYQEKQIFMSNLLGPDGEPLYYEQEYKPGFIDFESYTD